MPTRENHLNILVIEDNPADFYLIESMLRSSPIEVKDIYHATRISEARSFLQTHDMGLVLLDLSLPDSFGIDSFQQIKSLVQHIPVIVLTGLSESGVAVEALKQGAQDYLVKGEFKTDLLARAIQYSIERKSAEEKISISEKNYRQIFYQNPFPAWIYDLESLRILEVNDAAIRVYGYSREEFLAMSKKDMRQDKAIGINEATHNRSDKQREHSGVYRHKKKNGEIIIVDPTSYPVSYSGRTAMQVIINDITEKLRLEKELQDQQNQKHQQIGEAILIAQEEERKTLAAELHDNINQILATARLFIASGILGNDPLSDLLSKGQECIDLAIGEIRKLSKTLTIPGFISTGFGQAIKDLTTDIQAVKKINIITELDASEDTHLSEILKITIYRIIQEQLNNILKHAEASEVKIKVHAREDTVLLTITDNGKGFDTHLRTNGIGITNIQHRAELFNGHVEIDSSPGNGCSLKVELKIKVLMPQKAA